MTSQRYIRNGHFRFSSNVLPSAAPPQPLMLQPPRHLQQSVGAVITYTPKEDMVIEVQKPRLSYLRNAWMCFKYTFLFLVSTLAWITLGEFAEIFNQRDAFNLVCAVVFVFKNYKYLLSNIKITLCIICIVLFCRNQESWYRYQAQMDARVCVSTCTPVVVNVSGGDLPKNSTVLNTADVPLASTPVVEPTPVIHEIPVIIPSNSTVSAFVSNVIGASRGWITDTRNTVIDIALLPSRVVDDSLDKAQRAVDLGQQTQDLVREFIFTMNHAINLLIRLTLTLMSGTVLFRSRKLMGF